MPVSTCLGPGRTICLSAVALLVVGTLPAAAQTAAGGTRPEATARNAPARPPATAPQPARAKAPNNGSDEAPVTSTGAKAPPTDATGDRTTVAPDRDATAGDKDADDASGRAAITIDLKPTAILAGHDLRATVKVQPNSDNRLLAVKIDAPTFYASTERELMGASSPRTYNFKWEKLPAGLYRVEAIVTDADGRLTRVSRDFQVHGGIIDAEMGPVGPPTRGRRRR